MSREASTRATRLRNKEVQKEEAADQPRERRASLDVKLVADLVEDNNTIVHFFIIFGAVFMGFAILSAMIFVDASHQHNTMWAQARMFLGIMLMVLSLFVLEPRVGLWITPWKMFSNVATTIVESPRKGGIKSEANSWWEWRKEQFEENTPILSPRAGGNKKTAFDWDKGKKQ